MVRQKSIGDQELSLLRFVAERGGATVGEVSESFGGEKGLSRSTILTMMERLREKGRLKRRKVGGIFRYVSPVPHEQVMQDVVESFVERTLAGSVSPFVNYLVEKTEVSAEELAELEELVAKLQAKRKETRP